MNAHPLWARIRAIAARAAPTTPLGIGLATSLLLHGLVLALQFRPPGPIRFKATDPQLELVLVNAQTRARPRSPEVAAQVQMAAGGERERSRAPRPAAAQESKTDLTSALSETELAPFRALRDHLRALARDQTPPDAPAVRSQTTSGRAPDEAAPLEQALARAQAQLDRQLSEAGRGPRRLTYGVNAVAVSYARYVEAWARTIERLGTELYPPQARGRLYDSMIITVEIDRSGRVVDIIINRPSRHAVLNEAVKRIVHAGAPYPPFTDDMASDIDILQIVRTWNFTRESLQTGTLPPADTQPRP